jgi:uncharacterized protein
MLQVERLVVDTNVVVGAMLSTDGANRKILRACLERRVQPVVGQALLHEYEDVMARSVLFRKCPLSDSEREELLDAFLSVCEWATVYYSWRPNLPDEGDNHLIELAVAASAHWILTHNVRHFEKTALRFPEIRIARPQTFLKELT